MNITKKTHSIDHHTLTQNMTARNRRFHHKKDISEILRDELDHDHDFR